MVKIIGCPVETTLAMIGKKWTLNILNDIMFGIRRFNELLNKNDGLTSKILSDRLKLLETNKLIEKKIITLTPIKIEYHLTENGGQLDKILFEIAKFAALTKPEEVLDDPDASLRDIVESIGSRYHLTEREIDFYSAEEILV